jgi:hypothetical protein
MAKDILQRAALETILAQLAPPKRTSASSACSGGSILASG